MLRTRQSLGSPSPKRKKTAAEFARSGTKADSTAAIYTSPKLRPAGPKRLCPNGFFVGSGNNGEMVQGILAEHGFTSVEKSSADVRFVWIQSLKEINIGAYREGHVFINHLPNTFSALANKKSIAQIVSSLPDFPAPISFDLLDPRSRARFLTIPDDWKLIVKPYAANCGRGITVINDVREYKERVKNRSIKLNKIAQRYIEDLLLVDGYKFDIRAYVLIASCKPLIFLMHHEYYGRRSLVPYDSESSELLSHLTNASQQKKHPTFNDRKEESILSPEFMKERLGHELMISVESQMRTAARTLMQAAAPKLDQRSGSFQLLGFDFMIDQSGKVYLIEINVNPAIYTDTSTQERIITKVVADTIKVVLTLKQGQKDYLAETGFASLTN